MNKVIKETDDLTILIKIKNDEGIQWSIILAETIDVIRGLGYAGKKLDDLQEQIINDIK